jgi:hypothetical protein
MGKKLKDDFIEMAFENLARSAINYCIEEAMLGLGK